MISFASGKSNTMISLFKCKHKWVLAIPEKDVKIGGNVPYVCSKCGVKHIAKPRRRD